MACQVDLCPAIRLSDNEYSFYNMRLASWHHALQTIPNGRTSQSCDSALWLQTPESRIGLGNDSPEGYDVPRGEEVWVSSEGGLQRPVRRKLASLLNKIEFGPWLKHTDKMCNEVRRQRTFYETEN